jgi:FkbM family methyltransferase
MRYVVDIGASEGIFTTYVAKQNRRGRGKPITVFAVEPIPIVAAKIRPQNNVFVLTNAILPRKLIPPSGKILLNVFKNYELSSVHSINPELDKEIWAKHLGGTDLSEVIEVPAITLESLIAENNLPWIDFLKIDTQGSDLDVLESAGTLGDRIKAVVLELPYSPEYSLYHGGTPLIDAINKCKELGFFPIRMVPNGGGECNLFLIREGLSVEDYFRLEKELSLDKAPVLKIGRHDPYINSQWPVRLFAGLNSILAKCVRFVKVSNK